MSSSSWGSSSNSYLFPRSEFLCEGSIWLKSRLRLAEADKKGEQAATDRLDALRSEKREAVAELEQMHAKKMSTAVEAAKAESQAAYEKKLREMEAGHDAAIKQAVAAKEEELEAVRRKAVEAAHLEGQKSGQTAGSETAKRELDAGSCVCVSAGA